MMGELECAVTGKGFDALLQPPYDTDILQPVLRRACVFARMSPDNKRDLIEMLGAGLQAAPEPGCPNLGLHVGFCGDGANDCGALKAAHVGERILVQLQKDRAAWGWIILQFPGLMGTLHVTEPFACTGALHSKSVRTHWPLCHPVCCHDCRRCVVV